MILSPDMKKIDVIDWNFLKKVGNPMDDIANFLFRLLIKSKTKSKIDAFKSKIENSDTEFNKLQIEIEKQLSNHFDYKFSILFSMKFHFLKSLYSKILNNETLSLDLEYVSILSQISAKNKLNYGMAKIQSQTRKYIRNKLDKHKKLQNLSTSLYLNYCNLVGPLHVLPNFMIIGFPKCGTTSLYDYLTQHPQIVPPLGKEIDFLIDFMNEELIGIEFDFLV